MRYLRKYNESNHYIETIRKNCEDILLPLNDSNIYTRVYLYSEKNNQIAIEIFGDPILKLEDFDSELNHLLSYLEDEGFTLIRNKEYTIVNCSKLKSDLLICPECGSKKISQDYNLDDGGEARDYTPYVCNSCHHDGKKEDFIDDDYPIDINKLKYLISNKYEVEYISLLFGKRR